MPSTKIRPCFTRISMTISTTSLSLKLSSLFRSLTTFAFWAATRIYLTGTTIQWRNHPRQIIHTRPVFKPLLNKIHYFFHHSRKFLDNMMQSIWLWNLLEPVELIGQDFDALCKTCHCTMRFFLSLKMLRRSMHSFRWHRKKRDQLCRRSQHKRIRFELQNWAASR